MARSSSLKTASFFLRKHRRRPHSPFKTRWHQILNQQLAMRHFKQSAISPPSSPYPNLLSSLVNSFQLYHCQPTPQAYHFLLHFVSNNSLLHHIPPLLDHLRNSPNFQTPDSIFAHLIRIYGRANRIHDAVNLFFDIPMFRCVPSVSLLNTLLSVLCSTDEGLELVPHVLLKSREMNIGLQESTFLLLIEALCRADKVGYAVELFRFMMGDGCCISSKMCSLLLKSVCQQVGVSSSVDSVEFLGELRGLGFCPVMFDYSNVIRSLVRKGKGADALNVLNQMKSDGIKPDVACYTMVLDGLVEDGCYSDADKVFDEMLVLGLAPDVYTYNVYIKGLCKQSNTEAGIKMISCMEELGCQPNLTTYNILLSSLFTSGEVSRGWDFVRYMHGKGTEPGTQTYEIVIDGLVGSGKMMEAYDLLEEVSGKGLSVNSSTFDGLICGMCGIGETDKALGLLERMLSKNMSPSARAWGALLVGCKFSNTALKDDICL